jgi:hypothetical protein
VSRVGDEAQKFSSMSKTASQSQCYVILHCHATRASLSSGTGWASLDSSF